MVRGTAEVRVTTGILRLATLLGWSAFLTWLVASGEVYRYIGPRTRWVVVFGAVALALAALIHARTVLPSRSTTGARQGSGQEILGVATLLTPIAIVMLIPKPSLGSEAASRRANPTFVSAASSFAPVPQPDGDVSFPEINYASKSEDYAVTVGIADGYEVELTGFVTHPADGPEETFALTRFQTFCCAADAVPFSVTVDPQHPRDYPEDTWLTVSGYVRDQGAGCVLQAERITATAEPVNPYI